MLVRLVTVNLGSVPLLFVAGRDAEDLRDRSYIYRTHVGRVITACGIKSST